MMKWIMGILTPSTLVIMGIVLIIYKPKINSWFGYRTKKSMKNEARWKFTNRILALCLIYLNTLFCIPLICILNVFMSNTLGIVLSVLGIVMLGLIISIIITEIKLNQFIKRENHHNKTNKN